MDKKNCQIAAAKNIRQIEDSWVLARWVRIKLEKLHRIYIWIFLWNFMLLSHQPYHTYFILLINMLMFISYHFSFFCKILHLVHLPFFELARIWILFSLFSRLSKSSVYSIIEIRRWCHKLQVYTLCHLWNFYSE